MASSVWFPTATREGIRTHTLPSAPCSQIVVWNMDSSAGAAALLLVKVRVVEARRALSAPPNIPRRAGRWRL